MIVMDAKGQSWPILSIESNVAPMSFYLATGIVASFHGATIRGSASSIIETHESIKTKENWSLGIHSMDENPFFRPQSRGKIDDTVFKYRTATHWPH
jgi:hypothetical protein